MSDSEFNLSFDQEQGSCIELIAEQCTDCGGSGYIRKTKKNGEPFKTK